MVARQKALINESLLVWARDQSGLTVEAAAKKLGVPPGRLLSWEAGTDKPTIIQLRKIARVYEFSFSVFFLPSPPKGFQPIKDFRRLSVSTGAELSTELTLEIRRAYDRRDIALELYGDLELVPEPFTLRVADSELPERFAERLREALGVTAKEQEGWRDPSVGFREWRTRIERVGVMVFQASGIDLEEMRGFSVGDSTLPLMVVNRSDSYAGRSFTLLHELAHIALDDEGLCNLHEDGPPSLASRRVEKFCNAVAGAALVPANSLLGIIEVQRHPAVRWEPRELEHIARRFAVSREVIVRRLLDLGRTNQSEYARTIGLLEAEFRALPSRKKGFLTPPADFLSLAGKAYAGLVLTAYRENKLGASELADVLGMRLKHLGVIEGALST